MATFVKGVGYTADLNAVIALARNLREDGVEKPVVNAAEGYFGVWRHDIANDEYAREIVQDAEAALAER